MGERKFRRRLKAPFSVRYLHYGSTENFFLDVKNQTSLHPESYRKSLSVLREISSILPPLDDNFDGSVLSAYRFASMCCASEEIKGNAAIRTSRVSRNFCFTWVHFLCADSMRSDYITNDRACDSVFYEFKVNDKEGIEVFPTLRPKPRHLWEEGAVAQVSNDRPDPWNKKFPWLDSRPLGIRAEDLTITELELFLVLFDWKAKTPEFSWWVKEWPAILSQVQRYALRHYSWSLLRALRMARKAAPAHVQRAVPHGHLRGLERIWGLVLLGGVTLASVLPGGTRWYRPPLFFEQTWWTLSILAVALAGIGVLCWQDVHKQNEGLLHASGHAVRRTLRLWLFAAVPGILAAAVVYGVGLFDAKGFGPVEAIFQNPWMLWDITAIGRGIHTVLGIVAMGSLAALVGIFGQWIFQNVPLTEPV